MARRSEFKLDHAGMAEILLSDGIRHAVHDAAEQVAARVRGDSAIQRNELVDEVEVEDYTTDRAASSVTITHAAGLGIEAKHGTLSRAAGGAS